MIEVTSRGPSRLTLEPIPPRSAVRPGETFALRYRLRNRGDRVARKVVVGVSSDDPDGPRVVDSELHRVGSVDDTIEGRFLLKAPGPGRYRLVLGADSNATHPRKLIEVSVVSEPTQATELPSLLRIALAGGLMVTGGLVGLRGRPSRAARD